MNASKQNYPSLKGRSVIVTGGGRGLGKEMALALAECGANVMVTAANNPDELKAVQQETGANGRIEIMQADATSYVSETFTTQPCLFWETPPAQWQTIIDCNINGPFNMARAITPHLVEQGLGKIINVSTSLQTMTRTGYSPYGPSKAALEAASKVWAADLAGTGVTVNILLPGGATDTALLPDMVNKKGADGQLLSPSLMRAPILWLCADDSNQHTAERYIAKDWTIDTDSTAAANAARDTTVNS